MKVSGNSAHIYKNKVLHHGTLLFSSDLNALKKAIAGREEHYKDKSVKSIRSIVSNISELLPVKISGTEFLTLFREFICKDYPGTYIDEFRENEKELIVKLVEEKYKKHEWNFGYSPEYKYDAECIMQKGNCTISLAVKEGLIIKAEITGPLEDASFLNTVANRLTGVMHEKKSISERLKKLTFVSENERQIVNQIIQHLF